MTLLVAGALFGIVCWIFVAARIAVGRPWDYEAPDPEAGAASGRSLSVVVPARNEAENLRQCLPTLLGQNLDVPWEVIVVDDRSTDDTRAVLEGLEAEELRPVRGEPRPEGWTGKNWAAHQGYRRSRGDWLLFTDADVRFAPGALREALDGAEPDRLTSRLPRLEFREPLSRIIEPTLGLGLSALAPLSRVNDPERPEALAWGGFLLVPRELYERIGGHRAVRDRVVEDVALARRTAAAGAATELLVTDRLAHVCSRSPRETARRYRRYWASSWREDPGVAAAALAVLLGGHLLPAALWIGGGASAAGGWALAGLLALSHLVALPAYLGTGLSPLWALGLWPALLIHALMALLTAPGGLRSR